MVDLLASFAVEESDAGIRIDKLLSTRLPHLSRMRIQQAIRDGRARYDGATIIDPSARVKLGAVIAIDAPPAAQPSAVAAESIALAVLFEDADVIVIDKPAGLVVHPAPGHAGGTLVNALLAHCGDSLSGIGGAVRPGIVHRLDKDTSGVMVAAKNDFAHFGLARQFADHGRDGGLIRRYDALVWGVPEQASGAIEAPLGRHPADRLRMAVVPAARGRRAVTHYTLVERLPRNDGMASHLAMELETGRTHQIRVHLAHLGHPVIGDPLYSRGYKTKSHALPDAISNSVGAFARQALHAGLLGFIHPRSKRRLLFETPPPADWERLRLMLRSGRAGD